MPKRGFLASTILLVAVCAASPARASGDAKAPRDVSLSGVTMERDGTPLSGVTVRVESPALIGGSRTTTSDKEGRFRFPALPVGSYTLQGELFGYFEDPGRKLDLNATDTHVAVVLEKDPDEKIGIEVRAHEDIVTRCGPPTTLENAERADLIGVWCPDNVTHVGGAVKLGPPRMRLAGDISILDAEASYSSRLEAALGRLSDWQCQILFLSQGSTKAPSQDGLAAYIDLTSDEGALPYHWYFTKRPVEDTIAMLQTLRRWNDLLPHERWWLADVVVVGRIGRGSRLEEATVCKGGLPSASSRWSVTFKHMAEHVAPVPAGVLSQPYLWFLGENQGTGSPLVVLGYEEIDDGAGCPRPPPGPARGVVCY